MWLFFRLAVIQSCVLCGFSQKKKKKDFKPVSQVPTSHRAHQCVRVCCLSHGREGPTAGIKSFPHPPRAAASRCRPKHTKADLMCDLQVPQIGYLDPLLFGEHFIGDPWLASPCLAGWKGLVMRCPCACGLEDHK